MRVVTQHALHWGATLNRDQIIKSLCRAYPVNQVEYNEALTKCTKSTKCNLMRLDLSYKCIRWIIPQILFVSQLNRPIKIIFNTFMLRCILSNNALWFLWGNGVKPLHCCTWCTWCTCLLRLMYFVHLMHLVWEAREAIVSQSTLNHQQIGNKQIEACFPF